MEGTKEWCANEHFISYAIGIYILDYIEINIHWLYGVMEMLKVGIFFHKFLQEIQV